MPNSFIYDDFQTARIKSNKSWAAEWDQSFPYFVQLVFAGAPILKETIPKKSPHTLIAIPPPQLANLTYISTQI